MNLDVSTYGDLFDDGFVAVTRMGRVAVARVSCACVRERQAMIVRETLTELGRKMHGRLVVGLEEVESISAACLGDLRALKEMCEQLGGRLVLFGLSEDLREALVPTGFLEMLNIAEDQQGALAMLREKAGTGTPPPRRAA